MSEVWQIDHRKISEYVGRIPPLERFYGGRHFEQGALQVYAGPMFSEKSGEMIRLFKRIGAHHNVRCKAFKPYTDTRSPSDVITSRSAGDYPCTPIHADRPEEILKYVEPETQILGIDEAQFFSTGLVEVVTALRIRKRHVIAAALTTDSKGNPFLTSAILAMSAPFSLEALTGACDFSDDCAREGVYSQLVNPDGSAVLDADTVRIEGADAKYELRCMGHFQRPR